MGGYDNWPMHMDSGSAWLGALLLLTLLLAALLALLAVLGRPTGARQETAQRILDERFAHGEIDEQEYRARRNALQG